MFKRECKKRGIELKQKRKFNPKLKEEIISLYEQGKTENEIIEIVKDSKIVYLTIQRYKKEKGQFTGHKGRTKESHEYLQRMSETKKRFSNEIKNLLISKVDELKDFNLVIEWALKELNIEIAYSTLAGYYNSSSKKIGRNNRIGKTTKKRILSEEQTKILFQLKENGLLNKDIKKYFEEQLNVIIGLSTISKIYNRDKNAN